VVREVVRDESEKTRELLGSEGEKTRGVLKGTLQEDIAKWQQPSKRTSSRCEHIVTIPSSIWVKRVHQV
jgi:hypothetical protein